MIYAVALPFAALITAMLVIRLMRGLHRASNLRSQQPPLSISSTHPTPSDQFHETIWLPLCQSVAEAAQVKLGRALTPQERKIIWRSRSPLVLEIIAKEIAQASGSEEVSALISRIPSGIDRPDPTQWCQAVTTA